MLLFHSRFSVACLFQQMSNFVRLANPIYRHETFYKNFHLQSSIRSNVADALA